MNIDLDRKEMQYVIGTCDQCCGYYPRVDSEIDKSIKYRIYCQWCGNGVEADKLWKAVTGWNITTRKRTGVI